MAYPSSRCVVFDRDALRGVCSPRVSLLLLPPWQIFYSDRLHYSVPIDDGSGHGCCSVS